MQNTGNINYSLNKNDIYKVLGGCVGYFVPHYYALVLISIIYIFTIRNQQYYFSQREPKYKTDEDKLHFFKSITYNSPFKLLTLVENDRNSEYEDITEKNKFIGLSDKSYYLIIISYVITFIIILEGLIRNLIYSVYTGIIQINPNNNPYNNSTCIKKTNISPYTSIIANYTSILSMSVIFLFPFIIPYLLNFLKFDNYDIKHNNWITYVILFFMFYPLIIVLISKASFYKKLEIFPNINTFLDSKDYNFVKFISDNFAFKIYGIIVFIFIIFVFCYYKLMHVDLMNNKKKIITYLIISFIIFILIPSILVFFSLSILFDNKHVENSETDVIDDIKKNGITNLYSLLVKYNYPCFNK